MLADTFTSHERDGFQLSQRRRWIISLSSFENADYYCAKNSSSRLTSTIKILMFNKMPLHKKNLVNLRYIRNYRNYVLKNKKLHIKLFSYIFNLYKENPIYKIKIFQNINFKWWNSYLERFNSCVRSRNKDIVSWITMFTHGTLHYRTLIILLASLFPWSRS